MVCGKPHYGKFKQHCLEVKNRINLYRSAGVLCLSAETAKFCSFNTMLCVVFCFLLLFFPVTSALYFWLHFTLLKWKEVSASICFMLTYILMKENMCIFYCLVKYIFQVTGQSLEIRGLNLGFWVLLILKSIYFQCFTSTSLCGNLCLTVPLWKNWSFCECFCLWT